MNNNLKTIFFKLSYNQTLRKTTKKLFVYFPVLKSKLMDLRDNSYTKTTKEKQKYEGKFLNSIKKEIEEKRGKI